MKAVLERGPEPGREVEIAVGSPTLEVPVYNDYGFHCLIYRRRLERDVAGRFVYVFEGLRVRKPWVPAEDATVGG